MIHIVKGKLNQGKTSKILSMFNSDKAGDGIITRKMFKDGLFIGYEIVRLTSMESMPFIFIKEYKPQNWDEGLEYGRFSFSEKALLSAETIIDELISNGTDPVYLDEIGLLELNGRGFSRAFEKLLEAHRDTYVAVREQCVDEVLLKFKIDKYEIIEL